MSESKDWVAFPKETTTIFSYIRSAMENIVGLIVWLPISLGIGLLLKLGLIKPEPQANEVKGIIHHSQERDFS